MKRFKLSYVVLSLLTIAMMSSCASQKKVAKKIQENELGQELIIPCSDEEYHTDKKYFRATGIGLSVDLSTSKRKANMVASANLAASIHKIVKRVADQYTNEREMSNTDEFSRKFEQITREVVKQELVNMAEVCAKTYKKDGKYTTYMAVEVARKNIMDKVENRLSKEDKLKQDFEKMKFEKILDKEMEDYSKQ